MTNPVKIGLVGAAGRMGNEIIRVIAARNDVVLSSAAEDSASGHLGADAGEVARVGAVAWRSATTSPKWPSSATC